MLHVHEWQAAAVPMLFWDAPARFSQDMPRTRVVMTIHNMDSSGECRWAIGEGGRGWCGGGCAVANVCCFCRPPALQDSA